MKKLLTGPVTICSSATGESCVKFFGVVHQCRQPYFWMTESNMDHIFESDGLIINAKLLKRTQDNTVCAWNMSSCR